MKKVLSFFLVFAMLLVITQVDGGTVSAEQSGDFTYTLDNSAATITKYTGTGYDIDIPDNLGGFPVTSIGANAFRGCTGLINTTIPDSVTSIGPYAFSNCSNLSSVIISDSITSIAEGAFNNCSSLSEAYFCGNAPSSMGNFVFSGTKSDFKVYYITGKTGFSNPWYGYTTTTIPTNNPSNTATPSAITVSLKTSTALRVGQTEQLTATVLPADATNKNVEWSVYNGKNVVSVKDGLVTALTAGTAVVRATSALDSSRYAECTVTVNDALPAVNVQYHTQDEIRAYLTQNGASINDNVTYSAEPITSGGYNPGSLSKTTLNSALSMINQMRYIAGISYNVVLNDNYTVKAQAAALVNYLNGQLSHTPSKPNGLSEELYQLGYSGASSSNLAMGHGSLNDAIVRGWMDDGDDSNIDRVGHRRWILNPTMDATGFGRVGSFTAMYAIGSGNKSSYYGVAWPAQNMPTEYFGADYPWSISMGTNVDASSVKVTLTRLSDAKTWNFSNSSADGYFNVNNVGYGAKGCIIFRPNGINEYNNNDIFKVTITGLETPVSYTVNFFDLYKSISIDKTYLALTVGQAEQLTATVLPADAANKNVTWSVRSGNNAVSVKDGLVTALTEGTAVVRATISADNTKYAECTVTVNPTTTKPNTDGGGSIAIPNLGGGSSIAIPNIGVNEKAADNKPVDTTKSTTIVTNAASDGKTGPSVTVTTLTKANTNDIGKATAEVNQTQLIDAVNKVVAEGTKQGKGTTTKVEIKTDAPDDVKVIEISIPRIAVNSMTEKQVDVLTVSNPIANISFDQSAISTFSADKTGNVKITASKVEASTLSDTAKQVIGDRQVFNFTVASGDKIISQFNGSVKVSVPYTLKAGEDAGAIVIYYINADGELELVSNCIYDTNTKMITFKTNHFSKYAVGYNKVNFKDVAENAWYSKAVSFVAARNIATGLGNGIYNPNEQLTRGQFIVMVMKAYGIKPDGNATDNFVDAGNSYYTDYLATARRMGITSGVGDNKYEPTEEITREQMFTLLYNTLKLIKQLPSVQTGEGLSAYNDAKKISPWATEAMTAFVNAGIITGSDNKLNPQITTNRAQMAQVLYNLLNK